VIPPPGALASLGFRYRATAPAPDLVVLTVAARHADGAEVEAGVIAVDAADWRRHFRPMLSVLATPDGPLQLDDLTGLR
jgi:hypothetical protein